MSQSIIQFLIQPTPTPKKEFKQQKFSQNNFRILIIAAFLVLEQTYYALLGLLLFIIKYLDYPQFM